ncbi:hypothetical protein ACHAWF_016034 [Thalassiosira exigua]
MPKLAWTAPTTTAATTMPASKEEEEDAARLRRGGRRRRPALAPRTAVASALLAVSALLPNPCGATRHSFWTRDDARRLIGPIGSPFGFLTGGVYNLTVFDFELSLGRRRKKRGKADKKGDGGSAAGGDGGVGGAEYVDWSALRYVEAGFLLKRFDSESDFAKYRETVMEKPTLCAFEAHRGGDYVSIDPSNMDDDLLGADDSFEVKFDEGSGGGAGGEDKKSKEVGSVGVYLSMNQPEKSWRPYTASVEHSFTNQQDEGLYFLMFQLCPRDASGKDGKGASSIDVRASFELDLHFKNYDAFGNPSYLTAGEMALPRVYLYFSLSYLLCFVLWACNIRNVRLGRDPVWTARGEVVGGAHKPTVHAIHHLMTILLGLKTFTVFFEALRYRHIRLHGHAEFLSAVYFTMSFVKGTFMFTVILLIGSGWSLVKPVLGDREQKVIWLVLALQVVDNIAVAVLSQETEGERRYEDWSALLHFVDILCCCAVLVPIVWQVNALEKSVQAETTADEDGQSGEKVESSAIISDVRSEAPASADAARTLRKLKQFQRFYVLVVAYIYFTRIAVYLFATTLGYRSTWLRYFVTELGTLVFYAVVGMLFRPAVDNPYLEVRRVDDAGTEIEFATTSR